MFGFFIWLICKIHSLIECCIQSCLNTLIYICLAITVAYYLGWIERWIWWVLENEASKVFNNGLVTMGSFDIDWSEILQGKITLNASNVILHTKDRKEWQWESPVVGRIGQATVVCNAPITIFHDFFLRKELPIEVYTIKVSDVQVFVERREQVFNVYMFDPNMILPPPPSLPPRTDDSSDEGSSDHKGGDENAKQQTPNPVFLDASANSLQTLTEQSSSSSSHESDKSNKDDDHRNMAKHLVNDMISAVEALGRAAKAGNLQSAIRQQGLELASQLRTKEQLNQHVQVMKHVGKVAVESFSQAKPENMILERRKEENPQEVYCRIGRVVVQQLRIFTKDSWIKMDGDSSEQLQGVGPNGGRWNKPIYIETMTIRASELCPPMSLEDEDGMPALYQNIDKVLEVAWKRLLAEMAKSNGGRVFQTAIGELLNFMTPKDLQPSSATTTKSSTSTLTHNTTTSQSNVNPSSTSRGRSSSGRTTITSNFGGKKETKETATLGGTSSRVTRITTTSTPSSSSKANDPHIFTSQRSPQNESSFVMGEGVEVRV